MRWLSLSVILALIWLVVGCMTMPNYRDRYPDSERFEARAWLQTNPNQSALAGNRFGTSQAALEFVEQLYRAGAVTVYVVDPYDDERRIAQEGGPYADTLIVVMPSDPQRRHELFQIINAEAAREGFAPYTNTGQSEVLLWWD